MKPENTGHATQDDYKKAVPSSSAARPIATRWVAIASSSLLGVVCLDAFDFSKIFTKLPYAADGNEVSLALLALVAVIVLHRGAGFRSAHLTTALRHPPFALAVAIALWVHSAFSHLLNPEAVREKDLWLLVACAYSLTLIVFFGIAQWFSKKQKGEVHVGSRASEDRSSLDLLDPANFATWLSREEPINSANLDAFNFGARKDRIVGYLQDPARKTVSVVGPYGAGKSSLLHLVEADIKQNQTGDKIVFSTVSCWGFENGNAAAKEILKKVVCDLSERTDCLGLRGLADRYVQALSEASNLTEKFWTFSNESGPEEQLKRLSSLLLALKLRLVIVIEDADRNGKDFDVNQIEGLLTRLRDIERVSFVIATGPGTTFDFVRLSDHTEVLPDLQQGDIERVREYIRREQLKEYGDINTSRERRANPSATFFSQLLSVWHDENAWERQLASFLSTPRLLKRVFRRFTEAWKYLHGEVDIDELLIASALREGAPKAFAFLLQNHREIERLQGESNMSKDAQERLNRLKKLWEDIVDINANRTVVIRLMAAILPSCKYLANRVSLDQIASSQSFKLQEPFVYRDRIFSERISTDKPLDQPFLRRLVGVNADNGVADLAGMLLEAEAAHIQFEHFMPIFCPDVDLQRIASAMYEIARGNSLINAVVDGLKWISRQVFINWAQIEPIYSDWVKSELKKCIPNHLALASTLLGLLSGPSQDPRRGEFRRWLGKFAEDPVQKAGVANVVKGILPGGPMVLIVLTYDCLSEWNWISSLLIEGIKTYPVLAPYVARLVIGWEATAANLMRVSVSEDALTALFGHRAVELMNALNESLSQIPPWTEDQVVFNPQVFRDGIQSWLQGQHGAQGHSTLLEG
ncbi:MAG TPA: P-loop NTPase fold protein [Candidatus Limnocylindria bacterium]|nr:P-loop NTPase fold protein [Candidatus Limnocylindria bacterium]